LCHDRVTILLDQRRHPKTFSQLLVRPPRSFLAEHNWMEIEYSLFPVRFQRFTRLIFVAPEEDSGAENLEDGYTEKGKNVCP